LAQKVVLFAFVADKTGKKIADDIIDAFAKKSRKVAI